MNLDAFLLYANAAVGALLALLAWWAALSPRVHDGVVIKCGLILLGAGAAGISHSLLLEVDDPALILLRALGLLDAGIVLIAAGSAWRVWRRPRLRRRVSDWMGLDESEGSRHG